ncbi:MAG: ABC transporter ATP-binding protein [Firmicutes bacterium]|nr:ABC transporter ATP-binding protein [Bacillota bacterium]
MIGPGPGRHGMMGPKVRAKDARGTLKRLLKYLNRRKAKLILVIIMALTSSVLSLVGPYLTGVAIDTIKGGIGSVDFKKLANIIFIMVVFYGLSALMTWLQTFVMADISQNTVKELRKDLFEKLQTLPVSFFDTRTHGEIMSRLTNDIETISNTLMQSAVHMVSSLITVVGAFIMMLVLSPLLTIISLIVMPLGMALTFKIAEKTRKLFVTQQKELGEINGYIEEIVSGQRVVKAFTREKKAVLEFGNINIRLKEAGIKAQIFSGIIPPLMNVLNQLSFALVAGAGGWLVIKQVITVGVIASFITYSKYFSRPVNEIANQFNTIQSALAGAERVFEIMDQAPEVNTNNAEEKIDIENVKGEVIFDNVSFSYKKDVPILKNINIKAWPGQSIALVGPTGAGKTTIVNLLMRFYDVNEGSILIDGVDIRKYELERLRKSLGMVLQDTYLFSGTVRENIRYGRLDATDEEVEEAARLANAHSFIHRLPDGYDTMITEGGANLSQGQRQLITIARAILADPAILILDEATSSVDTMTEMKIQEAMLSLMKGRTSFVIAHRLSTIRAADQILVINNGEIIERGTHDGLMEAKGFYYNLYMSQFREPAQIA